MSREKKIIIMQREINDRKGQGEKVTRVQVSDSRDKAKESKMRMVERATWPDFKSIFKE